MSREDEIQDKVEDFRMGLIEPWEFANKMRHEVPWLLKELKRADAENARLARQRDVLRKIVLEWRDNLPFIADLIDRLDAKGCAKEFIDALSGEGGAG